MVTLLVAVLVPVSLAQVAGERDADDEDRDLDGRYDRYEAHRGRGPGGMPPWAPTESPYAGHWQPFVLPATDVHRPPAPPEPLSKEAHAELQELRKAARHRSPDHMAKAAYWDTGPATQRWTELSLEVVGAHGELNPPRIARALALVHIAMYDATLATWEAKAHYGRAPPTVADPALYGTFPPRMNPSYPSEHAAVASAAARVLAHLYPAAGEEALMTKAHEAGKSRVWAGANWPSDVAAGHALGEAVADAVLAWAKVDGSDVPWDGVVPEFPCSWHPTPPGADFAPLEPEWGGVQTWFLTSGEQFRAPLPPACDSEEWLQQTADVRDQRYALTPQELDIAIYWADGPNQVAPAGHLFLLALHVAEHHPLDTPHTARAFAYLGAVMHDAGVAVWDSKYTYWTERPVETIQETWDPAWLPGIPSPPFPGYVSGHAGFSAAGAKWIGHVWPDEAVAMRAMAYESALSRFYGGVHIVADNLEGLHMGEQVAELALSRAARDGAE